MSICLVNPPSPFANEPAMDTQLGLCYVAASLNLDNYKVEGIDFSAIKSFNYQDKNYLWRIPDDVNIYGIYCMTVQFKWAKEIIKHIKRINKEAKIVVGGPHASTVPEDFYKLGVDLVVNGYGDFEIQNHFLSNLFLNNKRVFNNNLIPYRDIFKQYQYHRTLNGQRAFHITTLRGCPYSCHFCDKKSVGRKVQYYPVELVLNEIDSLMRQYHTRSFVIYDDIFTLKKDRLEQFCKEFRNRDLLWRCWARTDLVDEYKLSLMFDSGLTSITFGVESGDDIVLKRINKKTTVEKNKKALNLCRELGIPVRCSLMYGNPGERYESLVNTIEMIEECQPSEWNLSILTPTPGSEFWDNPEKHRLKFDKQKIVDSDYLLLNRFKDTGIGEVLCEVDGQSIEELNERLWWFVEELERVCPRQQIQDTLQKIVKPI